MDKELNVKQAAKHLGLSVSWIYQLIGMGAIPYHQRPVRVKRPCRRGGGIWFIVAELDAWKDSGGKDETV